jgi:hypothetical protein
MMEGLSKRYVIEDRPAVSEFLQRNPQVVSSLASARGHIEGIWGSSAVVKLELSRSPEDEPTDDAVVAYIQTPDDVDLSIRKLSEFTTSWWRSARPAVFGRLVFDVERCDAV